MNKEKGFTMIELVMVIVIIGILAAIAIPRFLDLRANAQQAACQQSGGALRAAISNFYASNMINNPGDTATPWPDSCAWGVLSPYIQSWPADPTAGGAWETYYGDNTDGLLSVGQACPTPP